MSSRRSLSLPITLAIVMIVILVALTVGWVVLAVHGILAQKSAGLYWTLLSVGTTFFVLAVVGVVLYLTLSIKAINLTRRQSNFIDSVTHELKSPIASLKLYLQTLCRRPVSADEQAEFYEFMLDDVERLDSLINHILVAASLEKTSARQGNDAGDVDVAALLAECADGVCLRYRVPLEIIEKQLEPCIVKCPRMDLELILRNLIDNAVKYADGGQPRVQVRCGYDRARSRVIVQIGDNGAGIPHKLRRKVFGRFIRLGPELERNKPGTGLGLYIVRTLVDRLRGHIRISSGDEAVGTVFEVSLPAAPPRPVVAAKEGVELSR
jgi:signal transduction histidine kinase